MDEHDRVPAVWFPAVRAYSGADMFTERLYAGLNARGIRAEITWLPLRAEYAPGSVPVSKPPAWATVVHVNSWLHRRFFPQGLPIVSTLHSSVHDPALEPYKRSAQRRYHAAWIKRVEAANLRRAQRIVAVSHYTALAAQAAFGLHDIHVIHNGIDTEQFRPIQRAAPNRPFRLLYVGNWIARKGVDLLAPIIQTLGAGFDLHYTADRSGAHARFALPANAQCIGRLDTTGLVAAYQQADALLFPSRLEGLPLTVIEAMACGLPVIAANASSLPEVVEDGVTGLLCPQDDVQAFAKAARKLATNFSIWSGMRRSARKRIEQHFGHDAMVERYLLLYSATASEQRRERETPIHPA